MNFDIRSIFIMAVPVLLAVTVHEVAHGWVAYKFGDDTAKQAGRLTLNPLKHLDLVGTLVFVITQMIGWAKPVPVNPYNLKNPRRDMLWVSAAGPASNFLLAVLLSFCLKALAYFNAAVPYYFLAPLFLILKAGVIINIGLAVFNLLPVPPLDGSGILTGLLPLKWAQKYEELRPYGFVILLVLIFTNAVDKIIYPVIRTIAQILLG